MRCDQCPALICGQRIDDEYYSDCQLGYEQIEYKDNSDYTYCKKHLKTIKEKLDIINKIKYIQSKIPIQFGNCEYKINKKNLIYNENDILKKIDWVENELTNIFGENHLKMSWSIHSSQLKIMSYTTLDKIISIASLIIIPDYKINEK